MATTNGDNLVKRLLLLGIFLLSSMVPVMAQDDDKQTAQPISARYQFELPEEWIFTDQSPLFAEDDIFPLSETVLAATSEDVLEMVESDDFELFDSSFDGAFIVTALFPAPFFQIDGIDPDELVADFGESLTMDVDGKVTQETIELRGISGQNFVISMDNGQAGQLALLFDPSDNLLMFIAFGEKEFSTDIENALISLTFYQFSDEDLLDAENLTTTVEIAPDFAAIEMPAGWWLFQEDPDDLLVVTPLMNQQIFEAGAMEGLLMSQSLGIISTSVERDALPDAVYNEDGTLNLEAVIIEEIGEESNSVTVTDWDGAPGLAGIQFDVEVTDQDIQARGLLLDGDERLYIVAGVSTVESWDTYSELVDAILSTIHRVE